MLSVRGLAVLLLLFGFSAAEDETISETPIEVESTSPSPEVVTDAVSADWDSDPGADPNGHLDLEDPGLLPDTVDVSNLICNICNCTDNVVNCKDLDLRSPFESEDWKGLLTFRTPDVNNVDLSGNHFVTVPQFPALPIKRLNLSNSGIEILRDGAFSNLKYLAVLDLSRNKMSFVLGRRAFMGVSVDGSKPMPFMYLQHLNLAHNDIHSLSQDVFMYMPHLTFLDLSGNSLVTIDQVTMGALSELMRLKELRINECDLESLPTGIFRRLRRLQHLDLSGNRFAEVPRALTEAINLQYLNFNRNPIQAISERTPISNLTMLRELHMSRNTQLRSIAKSALGGLKSLVKFHMNYNPRLTELDPKFLEWEDDLGVEKWPLLEELYLNNNNISGIDSRMLERWSHLARVDFSSNPFVCDCTNQWMVDVLVPLINAMVVNASTAKMICRRPYDYRGLTFARLHEARARLPCAVTQVEVDALSLETAIMYGVLIGILIAFPLVMVIVILWRKGFFARCRKKMTSKEDYYDDEETDAF